MSKLQLEIIRDDVRFSTREVCERCGLGREQLVELVEYGVVTPLEAPEAATGDWYFTADMLQLLARAARLQRDLQLDTAGLAMSLDLLEELQQTRRQLERLRQLLAQQMA